MSEIHIRRNPGDLERTLVASNGSQTTVLGTESEVCSILGVHPSKLGEYINVKLSKPYARRRVAAYIAKEIGVPTGQLCARWKEVGVMKKI